MKRWIPFAIALIAQFAAGGAILLTQWGMRVIWSNILEGERLPDLTELSLRYAYIIPVLGILGTIIAALIQKRSPQDETGSRLLHFVTAITLILVSVLAYLMTQPAFYILWKLK